MTERCRKCGGVIRGTVDTRTGDTVCCCDVMRINHTDNIIIPATTRDMNDATNEIALRRHPWKLTDADREFMEGAQIKVDE